MALYFSRFVVRKGDMKFTVLSSPEHHYLMTAAMRVYIYGSRSAYRIMHVLNCITVDLERFSVESYSYYQKCSRRVYNLGHLITLLPYSLLKAWPEYYPLDVDCLFGT